MRWAREKKERKSDLFVKVNKFNRCSKKKKKELKTARNYSRKYKKNGGKPQRKNTFCLG